MAEKDGANPRIDLFVDEEGKHRWRYWRSSDIVGASSQGYVDRADRDDNLCKVLGGTLHDDGRGGLWLLRWVGDEHETIPVREVPRG